MYQFNYRNTGPTINKFGAVEDSRPRWYLETPAEDHVMIRDELAEKYGLRYDRVLKRWYSFNKPLINNQICGYKAHVIAAYKLKKMRQAIREQQNKDKPKLTKEERMIQKNKRKYAKKMAALAKSSFKYGILRNS